MKNIPVLLVLFVLFPKLIYCQDLNWARAFGSNLDDHCSNVVLDKYGNTYLAGSFGSYTYYSFEGTYTYYTTPFMFIEGDTLNNYGFNNTFLVKYDNNGNLVWGKSIGGNNGHDDMDLISGLVYDSIHDQILLSGNLTGIVTIDSVTMHCSSSDIFLAKFNLDGKCIWGKNFTGVGYNVVSDIDIDEIGNIYLTGRNSAPMSIDSITMEAGGFLAKINTEGRCLFAKKEFPYDDSTNNQHYLVPTNISIKNNELVIAGWTDMHVIQVDTILITNQKHNKFGGFYSGFLSKFDDSGNVIWAKYMGSPSGYLFGLEMEASGDIYCIGYQNDTSYYDTIRRIERGSFILKCDPFGNALILNPVGSNWKFITEDIKIDKSENCYVLGNYSDYGDSYVSLIKYSPELSIQWTKEIMGSGGEAYSLALNPDRSDVIIAGEFAGNILIDSTIAFINSDSTHRTSDIFFVKYDNFAGITNVKASKTTLRLFSNPTSGNFTISIPDGFIHKASLSLSIFDQVGKLVLEKKVEINGRTMAVDINGYSSGFYLISLSDGQKCYFGKVLLR